jgi:RNA polymerase sigma-70 factor, ECF subfamily
MRTALLLPARVERAGIGMLRLIHRLLTVLSNDALPLGSDSSTFGHVQTDTYGFRAFYEEYGPVVFGYLWRMVGDEQAAHDLTQDTFVRAWQQFQKISEYDRPVAWLFRVAAHLALNYRRDRSVRVRAQQRMEAHPRETASGEFDTVGTRDVVLKTLRRIPVRERTALVLHVIYGMPHAEIAEILGITPGAAKTILWRGREHFRAHYTEEEVAP